MSTIILKFGGAAVAKPEQFDLIAKIVLQRAEEYSRVVVVVSAMGTTTDQLLGLAREVHPQPPKRELDMLLSVGERISISLLAMALSKRGKNAISFTGSQSGIITSSEHTEAKIVDVRPKRLIRHLDNGEIIIVAGFQGVSRDGEITTLGRGGSDTTAVALGIALEAECVEFYKDVPGICSDDPKKNPEAFLLEKLSYEEAFDIVAKGAKVLHSRCILLAQKNNLPLYVRSFQYPEKKGTQIGEEPIERRQPPLYEESSAEVGSTTPSHSAHSR